MMLARAEEKRLKPYLVVEEDGLPRSVIADAARLRQVLINLMGNAIRYTDRGSVTVRLKGAPGRDSGHLVLTFEVEDTGVGIAAKDHVRIFDAFVQVGKPGRQKGTGLGLAIGSLLSRWAELSMSRARRVRARCSA
jgi:signal transduction histidine kinase